MVVALRLKIDGRASRLIVSCRDKAVKLALGRRNKIFASQKDSDVLSSLASAAGL